MNLLTSLPDQFNNLQSQQQGSALYSIRQKAFDTYNRLGIPTMRNEEWKYTRISSLLKKDYSFNIHPATPLINNEDLDSVRLPGSKNANELFFVNGVFYSSLSKINKDELVVMSLDEAANSEFKEIVQTHLGSSSKYMKDGMQALNTAFAANGLFVLVQKNKTLEQPVYIYHITDTRVDSLFVQPGSLFYLDENTTVEIVETYANFGSQESFTNEIIEIILQKDARLQYYKIQNEASHCHHVGTTHIHHAGKCFSNSITISLNGGTIRNNLNVILDAEYNEAHLYGLYIANGQTHIDNHTIVDNVKPNCYSNEFYKGIMNDKSTGVFNGKIFVRKDAQKTNAYQSNKNILLSDLASINTKPQLEIFADDVKCSHGCTIGRLDDEAMFYLRTRGIDEKKAQALLLHAFAMDILEQVKPTALRAYIEEIINQRLDFSEE